MVHHEWDAPDRGAKLRQAIGAIVRQRGWRLLSEAELMRRVEALLGDAPAGEVGPAIFRVYAQALYNACAGIEGDQRQRLGFEELSRYLHDVAWHVAKDLSRDERAEAVDRALADLYYRLAQPRTPERPSGVRDSGAFLVVAAQQLRNIIRKWRRDVCADWDRWVEHQVAPAESEPEQRVADHDFRRRVRHCFERTLQRHPRAKLQLYVVWRRHIEGVDYATISVELQMTVANVRVLYSRGLDQLRKDADWWDLGWELGLIA